MGGGIKHSGPVIVAVEVIAMPVVSETGVIGAGAIMTVAATAGRQIWIARRVGLTPIICTDDVPTETLVANGRLTVGCAFGAVMGNHKASARAIKTEVAKRPDAKR